jgi:hypothetical protein
MEYNKRTLQGSDVPHKPQSYDSRVWHTISKRNNSNAKGSVLTSVPKKDMAIPGH